MPTTDSEKSQKKKNTMDFASPTKKKEKKCFTFSHLLFMWFSFFSFTRFVFICVASVSISIVMRMEINLIEKIVSFTRFYRDSSASTQKKKTFRFFALSHIGTLKNGHRYMNWCSIWSLLCRWPSSTIKFTRINSHWTAINGKKRRCCTSVRWNTFKNHIQFNGRKMDSKLVDNLRIHFDNFALFMMSKDRIFFFGQLLARECALALTDMRARTCETLIAISKKSRHDMYLSALDFNQCLVESCLAKWDETFA